MARIAKAQSEAQGILKWNRAKTSESKQHRAFGRTHSQRGPRTSSSLTYANVTISHARIPFELTIWMQCSFRCCPG